MADGAGTFVGNRGNFQVGEYIFKTNDSAASSHNLEIGDSGKTYLVHCSVARTINLPAAAEGASYKFIVTDSTAASTINAESGVIQGVFTDDNDSTNVSDTTTITIGTSAAVGDWVHLVSDGTNWYVSGQCQHASAGFTV